MRRFVLTAVVLCAGAVLFASTAFATLAPAATTAKLATIVGTVYGTDGLPIPNADVGLSVLKGDLYRPVAELSTDTSGTVDATVKPGSYKLDVSAPGADPATTYLVAQKGEIYALEVTLQAYSAISGTVVGLDSGAPVAGAMVELYLRNTDGTWPTAPTVTLDATDGTYASGKIDAGEYRVYASAPGYEPGFHDDYGLGTPTSVFASRDTTVTDIDVALAAAVQSGYITGRTVTGSAETTVSGAYVFLYRQNADGTWPATTPGWGSPTRTVYSTSQGLYTSGELPLGNYKVRFWVNHVGSQWWQYVATVDEATVIALDTPNETVSGIDAWYAKP